MSENKPIPALVPETEGEPEDPQWYLQRMYDLTVEPLEGVAPRKTSATGL
ncbi:MAG TPA: hypothetical protein VNT75_28895 [Symbiobacteriaceae bacterium]|nr:hypothetical protein [Symbiobacteriaceae bacterium]